MFSFSGPDELSRLTTLFGHYVKQNQWECAKVTVRQIHARAPAKARDLLRDVATRPSSSSAFVYMASQEMSSLCGEILTASLAQSGFEMALQSCKALCSREQTRVLDRLGPFFCHCWKLIMFFFYVQAEGACRYDGSVEKVDAG